MPSFYPNEGEILMQMMGLHGLPQKVGLFRNVVPQDGGVTFTSFTELTSGGGRSYATKTIDNAINMSALAQSEWYISTNASGRAEAAYCHGSPPTTYMEWTFNSVDVADGYSVYGAFRWVELIPFDAGATEIFPGQTVKGATSLATGVVAAVVLFSGTWAAGTAAGWMIIKSQSGTFQNDENLYVSGEIATIAIRDAGTDYVVGDIVEVTQTGGSGAKLVVTSVDGYGGVTGLVVVEGGQGFTVANDLATVALTGVGNDDLTIDISTLATTAYAVSNTGTTFAGDSHKKVVVVDILTTAQAVSASKPVQYIAKDQATTA
jgi:hypothetical protein